MICVHYKDKAVKTTYWNNRHLESESYEHLCNVAKCKVFWNGTAGGMGTYHWALNG